MPSLLEQILSNKDNPSADFTMSPRVDSPRQLPDGSVVYTSTAGAINRILSLNPHLHKRATGVEGEYQLYNGWTPVNLDDKMTFLSLLKSDWTPATPFQMAFLVKKVTELAPLLSRDCIIVSDGLIWDRDKGELRKIKKDETIRSVS